MVFRLSMEEKTAIARKMGFTPSQSAADKTRTTGSFPCPVCGMRNKRARSSYLCAEHDSPALRHKHKRS